MNVSKGDLAIIVRAKKTPELLGHIVEVIGPTDKKLRVGADINRTWEVKYPDGRLILSKYSNGTEGMTESRPFADECLRRIPKPDLKDEEDVYSHKPLSYEVEEKV